jgi:hypothetical protein
MQAPLSPWLSPATLRNLADKLYEKRKSAALEVEQARQRGNALIDAKRCTDNNAPTCASPRRRQRRWPLQVT